MTSFTERRKHVRCDSLVCKVQVSSDKSTWHLADVVDISACGIRFETQQLFHCHSPMYLQIQIYHLLSEFNVTVEGVIARHETSLHGNTYGVYFRNMNPHTEIELDEIIRNRGRLNDAIVHAHEDGIYAFALTPTRRGSKTRILM